MATGQRPQARELVALGLLSATLLAYQIWLTRVIAVQHWHHLATLVIALALLGFGAAGILVTLRTEHARKKYEVWLQVSALCTAVGLVAGIGLASRLPLNMLALPWQWQQVAWLALYGLCLVPAFLSGALFVTVCFVRWPQQAGRIYAVDLLAGAGGALLILPLINLLGLLAALWLLVLMALLAAYLLEAGRSLRRAWLFLASTLALAGLLTVHIAPAEYKAVALRLLERDSRVVMQHDGLSRQLSVLDSAALHNAPGLSLTSGAGAPRQWQLFSNGDNAVPLLLPPLPPADYFPQLLGYAPYILRSGAERVLQLEVDSLWQTWIARAAGVQSQLIVCADGELIDLLRNLKDRRGEGIYPDGLALQSIAPRRYLAAAGPQFDVIGLTVASPEAGMAATQENYLLTRQGFAAAVERLDSHGVLAIDVQLHSLPRELVKLVAMLAEVLQQRQLPTADHLAIVRDWRNAVLLVSRSAIGVEARSRLRNWSQQQQFDLVALPDLQVEESNRFHHLSEPYFQPIQRLLAGNPVDSMTLFELHPATDNQPYFFRFTRWSTLSQWWLSADNFWRSQLDWGYLLAIAALLAAAVLAASLLLVPLWLSGHRAPSLWAWVYFSAIGVGFMFMEIGLLQQATLLLDATTLSMSAIVAAMLVGAGGGSALQQRWRPPDTAIQGLLLGVAGLALVALPLLRALFGLSAEWPLPGRLLMAFTPVLLIAVPMGFALPHAVSRIASIPPANPANIAWVWGLNGFSSVLGAVGASLVAVHWGLSTLLLAAAGCYLAAALALR